MKWMKKNKIMVIAILCCLLLTIAVYSVKFFFFPNEAKVIYGNRLSDRESVMISDQDLKKLEKNLESKEEISSASAFVSGNIFDVIVTVEDATTKDVAKTYPDEILSILDDDQKNYFDVQVFLKKKGEDASFPMIAYRHAGSDKFTYTKDR